jgi:hypothetical protein
MIQAKPVVPDQYWILRDRDRKIGNIQADSHGYSVCIDNNVTKFKTLDMLQERLSVTFESMPTVSLPTEVNSVQGYPTSSTPCNGVWDVKKHLPLWTQDERSKSWFAAGWYRVKQHRTWKIMFCPKLIVLDRYQYQGPFYSRIEAQAL